MTAGHWIVVFVVVQRLAELVIAKRNTKRLLDAGAYEVGASHYPAIVLVHTAWIAALAYVAPPFDAINWPLIGVFAVLQAARVWVLTTLGQLWTTRIIVVPDVPPIMTGPYRWVRHPNYLIVIGEIAVLPLAFGQWGLAAGFSAANLTVLWWRIRLENHTLESRRPR